MTVIAVKTRDNSRRKNWTDEEIDFLFDNFETMTLDEAVKELGRSKSSVRQKMVDLGIKFRTSWEINEYALYDAYDNIIAIGTIYEISERKGISLLQLKRYVQPCIQKRLKRRLVKL